MCQFTSLLTEHFVFVLLLPCVTHSSCSLPSCLCLSEKRRTLRLFCGLQGFFVYFFFTPPRAWLALHGRFTLASVWPKNAEKLRLFCRSRPPQWNNGFMVSSFLSFFIPKQMVKTYFFYNDVNIQIRRFFSELIEGKSCGKYCLIIIWIGTNTAFLTFFLGM